MAANPELEEIHRLFSEFGAGAPAQVSHGLNLTLELANPELMPLLLLDIFRKKDATRQALQDLNFVHFARFLPQRDHQALLVITEFDGPVESYVKDFVIAIGDVFDAILKYVKGAETVRPVKEFPDDFVEFVRQNNRVFVFPGVPYFGEYPLYSAYPDLTVIDILKRRDPPAGIAAPGANIDFGDVQGNVLRGFNATLGQHLALRIANPAAGRAFIDGLVNGKDDVLPQVTPATPWTTRPPYFLTIGVTADGLKALGVPQALRDRMPRAFIEGPADSGRAARNGDTGDCDPTHWELGRPEQPVHLLVSLYADADVPASVAEFARRSEQLQAALRPGGVEQVACHATRALPDKKVHFGYRDSISQPRIAGVVPDTDADLQPRSSPGEFLLGADYVSIYGGSSLGLKPAQLCENGTFAAVRVMDQDVDAFEQLLDQGVQKTGFDREWVAAKLMGRWRDGTPLSQAPLAAVDGAAPAPGQCSDFNAFDYAPSRDHPDVPDDAQGRVCPVGSHMRRMNPRSGLAAGAPYTHRLIRRGMPYEIDGADGKKRRGLYGMFLCADLERQFEFLLQEWANGDIAALGLRGTQDPIMGAQTRDASFRIPMEDGSTVTLENVPRLVKTRGSVYVLLPGLKALRALARGFDAGDGGEAPGPVYVDFGDGTRMRFWPDAFDPKDPRFLANPYPFYAAFRKAAPVSLVKHGDYRSWWVFSHELVTEVCEDESMYLKEAPGSSTDDRGLFFMDPPRHEQVRGMLDPMFARAIEGSEDVAREQAEAAIRDILRGGATFDLIPEYGNRVTRNVFMKMFGVPEWQWSFLGGQIDIILKHFDQMLPTLERAPAAAASTVVMGMFLAGQAFCPHAASSPELYCQLVQAKRDNQLAESELVKTALHFALGGYLSTDFLVGTAIHNLLSRPGALGEYLHASDAGRAAALEELMRFDAPFQLADRFAAQDTVLAGRPLKRGDRVTVVYGAANHDEAVFPNGDELRLARTIRPGENYVFGHGIHRCIGAPLAPKVARIAIDTLLARVPQIALAHGVPARYQDPYYRGFSSLLLLNR